MSTKRPISFATDTTPVIPEAQMPGVDGGHHAIRENRWADPAYYGGGRHAAPLLSDSEVTVAAQMQEALKALPREEQMSILNQLAHGALRNDPVPRPKTPHGQLLEVLAGLRPDQQMKLQRAYAGTGHIPLEFASMVDERAAEIDQRKAGFTDEFSKAVGNMRIVQDEILAMAESPTLQRITESCFHKIVEANNDGSLLLPVHSESTTSRRISDIKAVNEAKNIVSGMIDLPDFGVFLIQHNWDAAFSKATDFDGGEWRMPYPASVFELRISGHRTCLIAVSERDGHKDDLLALCIEVSVGWVTAGLWRMDAGQLLNLSPSTHIVDGGLSNAAEKILSIVLAQARAACIALEAEVAESEVVRAPHKLNAKRERAGKVPLFDYHVVSLANRKRYAPRLAEPGEVDVEHARRRLHFVRGHWRRYANHRSYVKWHLRGDPDLGFVDKEYRL